MECINQNEEKTDRIKKKIITAIIIILLLLVIILLFYWQMGSVYVGGIKEGQLPGTEALKEAENDRVRIQINARPFFKSGKSEGNLNIGNPDTNEYDMEVTITRDDTEEVIYESGRIPPGYYIDNDKLQVVLSKGSYIAKAKITYYNGEEEQVSYFVNQEITIEK